MLKSFFKLIGIWSTASFMLTIWRKGEFVGKDYLGNKYYRGKARKGYRHERRWVVYAGNIEASAIPAEWHGWMHHQTDVFPDENTLSFRRSWQKPHIPNATSTTQAYRPEGHVLSGGQRAKATGDYEAWSPE